MGSSKNVPREEGRAPLFLLPFWPPIDRPPHRGLALAIIRHQTGAADDGGWLWSLCESAPRICLEIARPPPPPPTLIIIPSMNPRNLSHTHPRFPPPRSSSKRFPVSIHRWSHGDWRLIFPHLVSSPAPPPLPQRPQALPPPSASASARPQGEIT